MPSNVTLNSGSGGANLLTRQVSHDGDTVQLQGVFLLGISGTEDSYTTGALAFAEDTAHSTGDYGIMPLAVRNDTLAALGGTDGDYAPLQVNASGALFIQEGSALDVSAATVTVDLGSNNDVTIDGSSIVQAEDAVHGTGDAGVMSLAVRNDTLAALAGTDGDYAPFQVNASGALYIQEGAALDVSAATVTVDLGANNDVTIDNSSIVHAEDSAHTSTDAGVMSLAVRNDTLAALAGTDGDYAPLQVNASGALFIQEGSAMDVSAATVTVDNGGTFATQVDGAALTALQLIDDTVFADDAAFTLASSKVTMAGAIRDDSLSTLTAIEGDAVPLRVSSTGALHVTGGGGGTEYTQDEAHTDPATASTMLIVRDDALSTQESLDGDWTLPRANARGALWVEVDGTNALDVSAATVTVANGGTFATQVDGDALTALQLIDDAVHADDAAFTLGTSKGVMMMGFAGTQSVNANDAGAIAMETDGAVHIHDGGNSITVDATTLTTIAGAVTGSEMQVDIVADGADLLTNTSFNAAFGTAGSADAQVMSVQGIASMTPILVDATGQGDVPITLSGEAVVLGAGSAAVGTFGIDATTSATGATSFTDGDVDNTDQELKATAGILFYLQVYNPNDAVSYLQLFNNAAPTIGVTAPDLSFPIPPQGFWESSFGATGIAFGTAISYAGTTTRAGSGDPTTGLVLNASYI